MGRPPFYIIASAAVSLGGLANGYDTGSIGALTTMRQFAATLGKLSPTLLGFTVSLIMLDGVVPSVFAGQLTDRWGRLRTIEVGSVCFMLGSVLQCSAHSLSQFLLGRAVAGIGEGIYLSNGTVYICEIAPAGHRGVLAALPQFMAAVGLCMGYFTCYGTVDISSSMAWRLPFIVMAVCGLALAASCLALPDSLRWLILHGRRADALKSLQRLDIAADEAHRDILVDDQQRASMSMLQSFLLLFRRGYRARTILALFIMGMVQLSGIDGVLYYAPTLFRQAGLASSKPSFFASGLSAIPMTAISIPAFLLYAADAVHPHGVARWVVVVAVFVFGLTYCATWAIVGKIYASEIQPTNTRAAANCVAQGLNFFANWLVAMITPILLDKSAYGAHFLFGGLALGTVGVLAAYMPETRGKSLESIQEAFTSGRSPIGSVALRRLQSLRQRTVVRGMEQTDAVSRGSVDDEAASISGASGHSVAPGRI